MPGADCGSDHIPVVNSIMIKLKKNGLREQKNSTKTATQYVRKR